jgi:hypothetical protein
MPIGRLAYVAAGAALVASTLLPAQEWTRTEQTDALRGTHFAEFSLVGKFLTPPKIPSIASPVIVVQCLPGKHGNYNGRFLAGFVKAGAVLNLPFVKSRIDGGKVQPDIGWVPSTDGLSVFFPELSFNNFLYGHIMKHKENTSGPARKVVLGIDEFMGGEIVMQFDMPDPSRIADECGVIVRKK